MHELGYTRDIIDTVLDAAEKNGAHEVRRVCITIGQLRDIVDDLFRKCFAHFAAGTIAENAAVEIDVVPFTVQCQECGFTWTVDNIYDDAQFYCPACGKNHYAMRTGMEFFINKIEVV